MSNANGSDPLFLNKALAGVLVTGIAFFLLGWLGSGLVYDTKAPGKVLDIAVVEEKAAAAPAEAGPPPIEPLLATADPAHGEEITRKLCATCHTFTEGGKAGTGPNLYGVVGDKHGHMAGFNYTSGMVAIQGPWTYDELNAWLYKPSSVLPNTAMKFAGLHSDKDRADVIDYLHTLSHTPVPLPGAK